MPVQRAWAHVQTVARSSGVSGGSRVAVLPVQTRSTLPDPTRAHLRATIERGLQRADVVVVSDALVDGEPGAATCVDARCAARLAEALDAEWILRSTITRVDAVYEVRLDALDGRGHTLASASERCEICGQDEVTELVVDRSAALAAKVRLLQRQSPRLTLRSRPSGAAVWIDGRLVGHTPLAREVDAGEHEVRVELPGYATERRSVTAVAGTEDALEVVLHDDPEAARRRRTWRGVGGAALGLGGSMLGVGMGLAIAGSIDGLLADDELRGLVARACTEGQRLGDRLGKPILAASVFPIVTSRWGMRVLKLLPPEARFFAATRAGEMPQAA